VVGGETRLSEKFRVSGKYRSGHKAKESWGAAKRKNEGGEGGKKQPRKKTKKIKLVGLFQKQKKAGGGGGGDLTRGNTKKKEK